ncbi:MAG: hypothetical protein AAF456_18420 [Planctomycetota bacterium]
MKRLKISLRLWFALFTICIVVLVPVSTAIRNSYEFDAFSQEAMAKFESAIEDRYEGMRLYSVTTSSSGSWWAGKQVNLNFGATSNAASVNNGRCGQRTEVSVEILQGSDVPIVKIWAVETPRNMEAIEVFRASIEGAAIVSTDIRPHKGVMVTIIE